MRFARNGEYEGYLHTDAFMATLADFRSSTRAREGRARAHEVTGSPGEEMPFCRAGS